MAYKMTKNGRIVRVNLPNKLPKSFIESVENNSDGDNFIKKAQKIIANAKVAYGI